MKLAENAMRCESYNCRAGRASPIESRTCRTGKTLDRVTSDFFPFPPTR